jgi:flagellar hook-associated protein 3 FlgL
MRVTSNTFSSRLLTQLNDLANRQNKLQAQAATGQRVQLAEDDPAAMRRVLELQSEAASLNQYASNIATLKETTTASYSVMRALKTVNDKAGEIAVAADGLSSPEELSAYATDVNQLIEKSLADANSKHRGDYLFAGTRVDKPPFEAVRDANGKITSVNYVGNSDAITAEINAGVTSEAQPVGANTTGSGPRGLLTDFGSGADYFAHLISLRDHLEARDTAAIASADVANIKKDEENILYHYGHIGAIQSRLDAAAGLNKDQAFAVDQNVSGLVDADLAQTLVRLTEVQNAYTAALQSGGTILKTSLLDYLR